MLNVFDYGIIVIYFLCMIIVGFVASRFTKSKEDFLVAGRRLSFPLYFGCMSALVLGGGSTIGSTKLGYLYGFGGIWLDLSLGIGLIAMGFFITSKLSKMKALSINEVIEGSYGATARAFSSVLTFIYTLTVSVVQVLAIGTIFNVALGWDSVRSMVVGGGIVILYTFIGGMWAVTMTDIIQFVIKTVGVLILAPIFAFSAVGGWDSLAASVPEANFSITSMGFESMLTYFLLYAPGILIGQDIWQRVFTAKNDRIAKTGAVSAGVYCIAYAFATVFLGMCVFTLYPEIDAQNAFATGVINFLPAGIRGFVLAAALAATMSCSSGTILACSTVLYNDMYQRFINRNPDEKKAVWINRGFALLIGGLVMVCALWLQDVLVALDVAYAYLSGTVFIPVLASFVLKKFSPKAGLLSLTASTIVVTGLFFKYGFTSNYPILYGMLTGLIVYILVNMINKNKVAQNDLAVNAADQSGKS